MDPQLDVLPNGLTVVQTPMPEMRSATILLLVDVGSRYEDDRLAGVSHLVEHMLFKGTERRRRSRDISRAIEGVGGIINASTDKELTVYWAKTASEHLELSVDILQDMFRASRFAPSDVRREKDVIIEELSMIADDPQELVHVLTDEILWPNQPLGREIAGSRESVMALGRADVLRYFSRYYGPNNAVVSIAGGIDAEKNLRMLERAFEGWGPADAGVPPAAAIPIAGPRSRIERRTGEQANVCVAFPGIPRQHRDRWTLDVLATILGGGTTSRLFVELRERLALAYDVQMYTSHFSDTGSIVIYLGTDPSKLHRALGHIFAQIDRIRRRGITRSELQHAQQLFRGRLSLGLEDTHSVANWFGVQQILHHEMVGPSRVADAVDAVQTRDVLAAARTYLDPAMARIVAVGPVTDIRLADSLIGA